MEGKGLSYVSQHCALLNRGGVIFVCMRFPWRDPNLPDWFGHAESALAAADADATRVDVESQVSLQDLKLLWPEKPEENWAKGHAFCRDDIIFGNRKRTTSTFHANLYQFGIVQRSDSSGTIL